MTGLRSRLYLTHRGFTLIELLIVIAIILILIAIALPNFLAAQTRSKVAKVMAEMRTVASAMNHYFTDYNIFPNPYYPFRMPPKQSGVLHKESFLWIVGVDSNPGGRWNAERQVGRQMTTPNLYLSEIPVDPFWSETFQKTIIGDDGITYGEIDDMKISACSNLYYSRGNNILRWGTNLPNNYPTFVADFMLHTPGPNLRIEQGSFSRHAFYDPTNGVGSDGDIYFIGSEYGFLGNGHFAHPPLYNP